ncbi:holo-ACP synthase [Dehalococcoidia bacterium]|nr:holo-ACP synthase [Dehalococcoidia bacterium]
MHAHGIDIVEISRIGAAIDSWGDRFLKRIYTEGEIEYCRGRLPQLAARFAGKEAVMKALGTGNRRVSWRDIEILPDRGGAPLVYLNGRARSRGDELGIDELAISLSHSREYAIASVVGGKSEDSNR